MSLSCTCTTAARSCARSLLRTSSRPSLVHPASQIRRRAPSRRWESATTAAASTNNPKVTSIVDQISQLTLLETADLVANLKSRLNIPDLPTAFSSAAPGASSSAPAPAVEEEDEASAPAAQEKTLFTLTLKSFDAGAKPKVIKEIKSMLGLSLVDSKKFVEGAPKMMREGVPKEEGEKIVETMKGLGAVVGMD